MAVEIRVLLVEDDEDDYILTSSLLDDVVGQEYEIVRAPSFEDGLRQVKICDIDVILVDFKLGERRGLDFIEAAERVGCHAPIILLTGIENLDLDLAVSAAGVSDYLLKSEINSGLLERSVRHAIERKRAEMAWRMVVEENNRLALAVSHLQTGVVISDSSQADNPIVFVNDGFCRLTGYSSTEVLGRNCRFLQGPKTDPDEVIKMRRTIDSHNPHYSPHVQNEALPVDW